MHGPFSSLYVDNLIIEGCDAAEVDQALDDGIKALEAGGLPLHEEERANQDMEVLGVRQLGKEK